MKSEMCLPRSASAGSPVRGTVSTSRILRTSSGAWRARAIVDCPPNDIPTMALAWGAISRIATARSRALPSVPPDLARPVGVPVARKVDREKWTTKSHRDGVPSMRVLRAAVDEHELRLGASPHECTQPSRRRHLDGDSAHDRRAVIGQAILHCVLVEQSELVVLEMFHHGRPPSKFLPKSPALTLLRCLQSILATGR